MLTWDDFADAAGAIYVVEVDDVRLELTLDLAVEVASAARDGGSFRLEFVGPSDPILPQAIYPFCRDGEVMEIFVVPIQRDSAGTRYEAVFY